MTYNKDVDTILGLVNKIKGKKPQQKVTKVKAPATSSSPDSGPFQVPEFHFPTFERYAEEAKGSDAWMNQGEPPVANLYRQQYTSEADMAKKRLLESGEEEDPLVPLDPSLSDAEAVNIEKRGEAFAKEYLRQFRMDRLKLNERFALNYVKQEPVKKMLPKAIRTQPVILKKLEALPEAEVEMAGLRYKDLGDKAEEAIKKEDAIEKIKRARERKRAVKEQFDKEIEEHKKAKESAPPSTPPRKTSVEGRLKMLMDFKTEVLDTYQLDSSSKAKAPKDVLQRAIQLGIINRHAGNVRLVTIKNTTDSMIETSTPSKSTSKKTPKKGGAAR